MSGVTVEQLAKQVGNIPLDKLIKQLQRAGVTVAKPSDVISEDQKEKLLSLLRKEHGESTEPLKKISLKRTSVSELKVKSSSGKSSTVSVVSKRRRVYVKKDLLDQLHKQESDPFRAGAQNVAAHATAAAGAGAGVAADLAVAERGASHGGGAQHALDQATAKTKQQARAAEYTEVIEDEALSTDAQGTQAQAAEQATAKGAAPKAGVETKKDKEKEQDEFRRKGKTKGRSDEAEDSGKKGKRKLKDYIIEDEEQIARSWKRSKHRAAKQKAELKQIIDAPNPHAFAKPTAPKIHEVKIPETITVAELAQKISVKSAEVIKVLMSMGVMATINQPLDQDTACLLLEELGHKAVPVQDTSIEEALTFEYSSAAQSRSPIVTVMGHVDHGKTSLLDYIRRSRVTDSEAGGITQHIGAYRVHTSRGDITFIDTPGHESFTAMRARGTHCTDIVILVVAADDGVMPQTAEAIQHAKAANVPIVVAINKIDKPEADPERVINELSQHELIPEAWGGDTIFKKVSAKVGTGIDELLEAVMLQAEMLQLTAPVAGPAQGTVIEAYLDKGRGPVATILVQKGTLARGDMVLAGVEYGRIKLMRNDKDELIDTALPSVPVEVLGLSGVPSAGDVVQVVTDENKAKEIAMYRQRKQRELRLARQRASQLEGFMDRMQQQGEGVKYLNIVLKADVQGSLEALIDSLVKLSTEEVKVKIIASAVGGFTESDINLAIASDAILVGFNVRANAQARKLAQQENVQLNYYSIIYDVVDGMQSVIKGKHAPKMKEQIVGIAEVREVFRSTKWGAVAGCMVTEGVVKRGGKIRVLRDNVVIYEGELESLRRFQDNINEANKGMECGIGVKNYNDVKLNDQIEVFEVVKVE